MHADRGRLLLAPHTPAALALAVRTRSAVGPGQMGGDLYDALLTPTGPRLLIGDVKGHGPTAAPLAAALLAAARPIAATEPDPLRLARTLDARIRPHLGLEDYITLLITDFHPSEVRLANCGHPHRCASPDPAWTRSPRPAPPRPSAWAPPPASNASPSARTSACCSTPTASPKPATATAPSSPSTPAPGPPCGHPIWTKPSINFSTCSTGTPLTPPRPTTSPCS
ncbi:hypothetical protein GCM10010365_74430 [Streptomyces poonensis]|uniref:PPM-type phosphatase domain-containing protein n=1 Tax=Streptomyces poonensis TaxID=68255 RepID=A0A918QD44_9ACTN|nr:SpoIIE family protein phosphatase [Streptomyces poonensis]GGZ42801.1 hypothetical protein GCM10010365_74430 [Streptomyces poonensis]